MTTKEETKAVVQWKGEPITITFADVKSLVCPLATDQEVAVFLKVCQVLQLNPFAGDCYLIKYAEREKAALIISLDAYLKAGEANLNFDGHESGIVLRDPRGGLEFREGAFLLEEERAGLVGGWSKVYRKDRSRPFYVAVNKKECIRLTRDGRPTEFWAEEKQPWMLRKVALKRALVEAFPSLFSGLASEVDYEATHAEVQEALPKPKGETAEGQLPVPYQKSNGEPDWPKFWARQKEKGYTEEDYHRMFGVASMKDWLAAGRTLEEAEELMAMSRGGRFRPGEAPTPTPPAKSGPGEAKAAPPGAQARTPKPPRDMATLKTLGDALTAVWEDFGVSRAEAARRCGLADHGALTNMKPSDIYQQVAGVEL